MRVRKLYSYIKKIRDYVSTFRKKLCVVYKIKYKLNIIYAYYESLRYMYFFIHAYIFFIYKDKRSEVFPLSTFSLLLHNEIV